MGQDAVPSLNVISANANNVEECCSTMFIEWRQRTPKASWKQLIEALKEIQLHQLASKLEELLQPAELYWIEGQGAFVTSEQQRSPKNLFKGIIVWK